MTRRSWQKLVFFVAFAGCCAVLSHAGEESSKCRFKEIKEPWLTISKSDIPEAKTYRGGIVLYDSSVLHNGAVAGANKGVFKKGAGKHTFRIGDLDCGFTVKEVFIGDKDDDLDAEDAGFKTVEFEIGDDQDYALAFPVQRRYGDDVYVYYRAGGYSYGRMGSAKVLLYDDNLDGKYVLGEDTYSAGGNYLYAPLTEYIPSRRAVYKLIEMKPDGSEIRYLEVPEGAPHEIQIQMDPPKGIEAEMAFINATGDCAFIAEGKRTKLAVKPGTYKPLYGILVNKKEEKVAALVVVPEGNSTSLKTTKKDTAEAEMLGDLFFKFKVEKDTRRAGHIAISPLSIELWSRSGERLVGWEFVGTPNVAYVDGKNDYSMGSFETG